MSRLSARYAQLIRMCRRRGCSREDAQELVQEAHLRFFEYQRSTKVRNVDSLLRRIVINLAITHFYQEQARPFAFGSVAKLDRRGMLIDPAPSPQHMAAVEQQLHGVMSLLSAVSARTCQMFIAQRGGYTYGEIAAAFFVRPRTVEKHLAAATVMLQEMMPAEFAAEPPRHGQT